MKLDFAICGIRNSNMRFKNYSIEHIETIVGRETTIATFSTTAKIISSIPFLTAVYYPLKRKEN